MPKTGRNDPCPCASGRKYKHCCLAKDQAAELATLSAKRAQLLAQQAEHRARVQDYRAALRQAQEPDTLTQDSNAVIGLINAGKLDAAERAARALLARYPEVHDGYDRLGMVYEARGDNKQAAHCYRKVIEFVRAHAHDYDPQFELTYHELIARLDPPAPAD